MHMVTFVYFVRWSCGQSQVLKEHIPGAGRETLLHVGEKEEKDGHVHLWRSLARWEPEG